MEDNEEAKYEIDLHNLEHILDALIDIIAKFKGIDSEVTQQDFLELLSTLDISKFIVSGIMYSSGMGPYHEDDEQDTDEIE